MPRYRAFLKSIGFLGYNSAKVGPILQNYLKKDIVDTKVYKFKNLDQYQLFDHLRDLPDEEFNKIQATDLLYPWVLKQVRDANKTDFNYYITQDILQIANIVNLLDDAASTERFISKPKGPSVPSMYDVLSLVMTNQI